MRPSPTSAPPSTARKQAWTCEARIVLITRLFGGGAKTREIDPISWLRSSAAKSAIRNWWRAAHAYEFSSLAALRRREEKLFGAPGTFDANGDPTGGPGALEVVVSSSKKSLSTLAYHEPPSNALNYAYFPAQPMNQPAAKLAMPNDEAWTSIKLVAPATDDSVQEALLEGLRVWLTLGGIGARSRRGSGALAVSTREETVKLGLPVSQGEIEDFLRNHCQSRPIAAGLAGVFSLARTRRVFIGPPQSTGEKAQKELLSVLRGARQDRDRPRSGGWGRSRWPEADAIRLKVDPARTWAHAPQPANQEQYPRAALGLPIVVHFKDEPRDPVDHHLLAVLPQVDREWPKLERYSSPILLRPVRFWQNDEVKYLPVAVFTDCTLPAEAMPLVTTKPDAEPASRDVVRSYKIQKHADATLRRIEKAFLEAAGFRPL